MITIRAIINDSETKWTIQLINETEFFDKMSKIDKPLAELTKREKKKDPN
jgi:hypothetical protein